MKKWQKIISVIIGGAIGICLAISLICIFDSKDSSPRRLSMSKFDSGYAEMLFIDQGAWGSYVELKINSTWSFGGQNGDKWLQKSAL